MDLIAKITALDSSIFIYAGLLGFLLAGIAIKRKPKNFKDYAISIESFSIPTLVATMAATLIGGGSIIGRVSLYYREGLLLLIPALIGFLDCIIFVRYILPKLGNYYGQISIASVISKIYGTSLIERFAGIVAYIYCFGVLALQVKVIGITIQYALGFESTTAIIISFAIITIYSAFGGIRSVIRTDIVQFIIFIIVLPIMGSFLVQENGGLYAIFEKISWKPSSNFSMLNYICLFIFSLTPNITPICIHRLLVGRSISKNTATMYLTVLLQLVCGVFAIMIAAIAIVKYQNIDGNMAMFKVVGDSINSNLASGLFAVAMLAVILSSADSLMNTGAVIFVENVIKDTVTDDKKRFY